MELAGTRDCGSVWWGALVVAAELCPCVGLFEACGGAGIGMPIAMLALCESVISRASYNILRTSRADGMACGLENCKRWSLAFSAITPSPTKAAEIGRVEEMLL